MRGAWCFEDLEVYQRALTAAEAIFLRTRSFPHEERFSLTDQLLRSSRAVGSLVAEAWARRTYRAAFAEKLNQAMAEAMETQAWLDHAMRCGYISAEEQREMKGEWNRIGGMLRRMIQESGSFSRPRPDVSRS